MKPTLLAFAALLFSHASAAPKPNMVIFLADDHGYADNSVYGLPSVRTPMMKSLAEEGMRFTEAYVASPACGPNRAALLSGLMPARNGAEPNHRMPKKGTLTMVKRLQEQGYDVAAFGKVGHGEETEMAKFDTAVVYKGHDGDHLLKLVGDFLDKRTSEKPLCLFVGDNRPHVSWSKESTYDPSIVTLPTQSIDTPETREHWARYLTDVTGMDKTMSGVDDLALKHFGNGDYLFAYTSDHGPQWPFGKWNLYDRGIKVPLLIRWPGKIKQGSTSKAMLSWIDIMPTLIDIADGPAPDGIDGRSFKQVLLGEKDDHRDTIFTTHSGDGIMNIYPIRSVRTERFKLIQNLLPDAYHSNHSDIQRKDGAGAYWDSWDKAAKQSPEAAAIVAKYHQRPEIEFYDVQKDPDELNNLASNPEYQQQVKEFTRNLDDWIEEQGDKLTVFNKPYPTSGPPPVEFVNDPNKNKSKKKKGK